jgi:hypothetical protein
MKLTPDANGEHPQNPAVPGLSPDGQHPAAVLAAGAFRSGVTEDGIRRLFAACDRIGLGLGPDAEAAVLARSYCNSP